MSDDESRAFASWLLAKRRAHPPIKRELRLGRLRVVYKRRSRDRPFGRFGGGWNWKLGVQAGGRTIIVALLVASIRVELSRPEEADDE